MLDANTTDNRTKEAAIEEEFLPLSPIAFHILVSLAGQDRHGYDIMKQVEADSEGRVIISIGTLYGAIKRLLKMGLIEESDREPGPDEDPRRRYYRITGLGERVAKAELKRLEKSVTLARPAFGNMALTTL